MFILNRINADQEKYKLSHVFIQADSADGQVSSSDRNIIFPPAI